MGDYSFSYVDELLSIEILFTSESVSFLTVITCGFSQCMVSL